MESDFPINYRGGDRWIAVLDLISGGGNVPAYPAVSVPETSTSPKLPQEKSGGMVRIRDSVTRDSASSKDEP